MSLTSAQIFSLLFVAALSVTTVLHVWLALRQMRHVAAHRVRVPDDFVERIPLVEHQKAADYTYSKTRLGLIDFAVGTLLLLALTYGGALQWLYEFWSRYFVAGNYAHGLALIASVTVIGFVVDLPFTLYRTFVVEASFGFNKTTWHLFFTDLAKQGMLAIVIGLPALLAVLWLMSAMGRYWWFYVWLFWLAFNLVALLLYPTLIAPWFNKFSPLDDAALKARIETLLSRCGFKSSGLFVMDGSKRSAHGNAYFTGFGNAKRIVFFDTLLTRLAPQEIEAVLAHELGHYRHRHVWRRMAMLAAVTLLFLYALGWLIDKPWFFAGLGVTGQSTAMALILFSLVLPVVLFPLAPLMSHLSRRHEYQADAYAAMQAQASDLIAALVKLYRDNASTLTPDPLFSLFYDSHPPAALRIAQLHKHLHGTA